ncbi:MAG: hypothetical protein ACE365_06400 [Gammaproteobacteria bacterium]
MKPEQFWAFVCSIIDENEFNSLVDKACNNQEQRIGLFNFFEPIIRWQKSFAKAILPDDPFENGTLPEDHDQAKLQYIAWAQKSTAAIKYYITPALMNILGFMIAESIMTIHEKSGVMTTSTIAHELTERQLISQFQIAMIALSIDFNIQLKINFSTPKHDEETHPTDKIETSEDPTEEKVSTFSTSSNSAFTSMDIYKKEKNIVTSEKKDNEETSSALIKSPNSTITPMATYKKETQLEEAAILETPPLYNSAPNNISRRFTNQEGILLTLFGSYIQPDLYHFKNQSYLASSENPTDEETLFESMHYALDSTLCAFISSINNALCYEIEYINSQRSREEYIQVDYNRLCQNLENIFYFILPNFYDALSLEAEEGYLISDTKKEHALFKRLLKISCLEKDDLCAIFSPNQALSSNPSSTFYSNGEEKETLNDAQIRAVNNT